MVVLLRSIVWILGIVLRPFRRRWRPGMPIECLVVGYGGANNTGAEARTGEAIRQMLSADPRAIVTLTSLDPERTLRYLKETERVRIAGINPIFVGSMTRLVLRSDVVVLVEGSCFKENFSPALLWFFLFTADLAQRLSLPTVAYGVDAGALTPANARWSKDVACKIDLLMVRTCAAAEKLHRMGIDRDILVTTDTAFTLVPETRLWAETVLSGEGIDLKRPVVGMAFEELFWWPVVPSPLRALRGIAQDRYKSIYYHSWKPGAKERSTAMKDAFAAYADWVAAEFGAQPVLFAMESLDIEPCKSVAARMRAKPTLIDADHVSATHIAALLRRMDWLVTCRYHALVLAMGGLVPPIGVAHDERIASIMDELGLLQEYYISYEEDDILRLLKEKTTALRVNADGVRKRIERALPTYLSRMAENGRRFAQLLADRFSAADEA